MESFHQMLEHARNQGFIHGVHISRRSPSISSLFFADDVLLFSKADKHHAQTLQCLFAKYQAMSGQQINSSKSAFMLSKHTLDHTMTAISSILSITKTNFDEKYLGLSATINRSKQSSFEYIISKITSRIQSWSSKFLSRAGRPKITTIPLGDGRALSKVEISSIVVYDGILVHEQLGPYTVNHGFPANHFSA
ncbi:hypothetical protein Cni_G20305 [Canna indica]|uniref:Reverse transcriptase domain-containing protein n=1 Tax=Canna indica TaxID=4628 RepID=A0AAQ3KPP5_9LILI|nr:hypothetical protein Cni_G20305 [Canna indica]